MTVPRGEADRLKTVADVGPRLIAPLAPTADTGFVRVLEGGETLATATLHPLAPVAAGGWWRRLIDTIRLWFA